MSELKESWSFIKKSKIYILISVLVFSLFSIIGFVFPFFEEQIFKIISELKLLFEGLNLWETIGLIFFNNARASLIAILAGVFFGVVPLIIALTNGYLVGFISRIVSNEFSIFELWRLLPHGIFELPAVLISVGLGLKIGIEILTKPTKENFIENLNKALKTFVLIIIPLLIIAAIIEGLLIFLF
jgi:stage II sporulation protein M